VGGDGHGIECPRVVEQYALALLGRPGGAVQRADGSTDGGHGLRAHRFVLLDALDPLSPAHRNALVLLFKEDRSIAEAAGVLGVPGAQ
jgi:DNA-directed RNA polymerase specialized sigma24 family protein